ncbi:tankyrase-like isoform X1 [Selaginella moellendorffii]|uniref:tankyrase-like isoform X1 n=2 Tax=Selaginella moellendorffii TaxID=88036 RepID=UPI000D1C9862|nr:tankyrase-like isoform X1 [Selaginella moellendorffii]XP_024534690.1 tankyrase-like isoform X1 [Selaginella moellendorffii]XP_024534691.1 tankyrase-like isoform X1 [Selaginella moellendorffii]|eukprot:XP_024534689.1 tankyrase-like isoform X1 [Selaginella moellendorffii]
MSKLQAQARVPCKAPDCLRSFTSKEYMLQHFRDSHGQCSGSTKAPSAPTPTPKVLACSDCGAKFRDHQQLHQHQRSSAAHMKVSGPRDGGKHFSCFVCGAKFDSPQYLDQHFLVKHAVEGMRRDDPERGRVLAYFRAKWNHPGSEASIIDILRVYNPGHRVKRFADYREKLMAQRGSRDEKIGKNGNEVLRFHGTTVLCGLGTPQQQSLCSNLSCSLCNIILAGFKKKKAKVDGFLRFGAGIYVTATSSKANDYVKAYGSSSGSRHHAMLVCKVLAGRVFKVTEDRPELVAPPDGYHSVSGEVGGILNFDELVVYDNAAILPQSIIVYDIM